MIHLVNFFFNNLGAMGEQVVPQGGKIQNKSLYITLKVLYGVIYLQKQINWIEIWKMCKKRTKNEINQNLI